MKFSISAQAQKYGEEVLSLLREYSASQYGAGEILFSVSVGFDVDDLRRYANSNQMPVRVRGKLHPVSERAASITYSVAPVLREMESSGVSDPAGACAKPLDYILSGLRERRPVTITLTNPWSGELTLSTPGKTVQAHLTDPIFVACVALGMSDSDMNELQTAIRLDHGELVPA